MPIKSLYHTRITIRYCPYTFSAYCSSAYQNNDINEFEKILKVNRRNIMEDPFIREHIEGMYGRVLSLHSFLLDSKLRGMHIPSREQKSVSYWEKYLHLVLDYCLGGLKLPQNSVKRLNICS